METFWTMFSVICIGVVLGAMVYAPLLVYGLGMAISTNTGVLSGALGVATYAAFGLYKRSKRK